VALHERRYLLSEMVQIDDDLRHASFDKAPNHVFEQRLSADLDKRFRAGVG
jgi:hypothetical protein